MTEPEPQLEPWSVRARPALWLAVGFFLLLALAILANFGFYRLELPHPTAPPPHAFPSPDWEVHLRHEKYQLPNPPPPSDYAWVDRAHGRVRIPISRAMELVAAKGARAWEPLEQGPTQ